MAVAIWKHDRKVGVAVGMDGRRLILAYLWGSYTVALVVSNRPVSVRSRYVEFCGYGGYVPDVLDVFIQPSFQQSEELRN